MFCTIFSDLCDELVIFIGDGHDIDNPDRLQMYLSNIPSGQSYKCSMWYAQCIDPGNMALYDYGRIGNKAKYGQPEPPMVPLENIKIPLATFSGLYDSLADPADVIWLLD